MLCSPDYFKDIGYTLKRNDVSGLQERQILITGATGLIGSALIDMLIWLNEKRDHHVDIFAASRDLGSIRKRFAPYSGKEYFHAVRYDATRSFSFDGTVDYIICGAGNAHPESIGKEPVETMLANFCGLNSILEYARVHAVKRVLYISSSEIYGRKRDTGPYRETDHGYVDLLDPRSSYPGSKRAAETLCAAYLKEYGVDSVIVRPGHIYGPTQTEQDSRASAQFLRSAAAGEDIVMKSAGTQMRSYCHCLDCAAAIFTVLLRGKAGEAYNISNPDSVVSIRDFAETCAAAAGKVVRYELPSDTERAGYNRMENSALDPEKLMALGWRGVWDFKTGVEESVQQLKVSAGSGGDSSC